MKETYYIYDAGGVQVATYTQDLTTPAPMVVLQNHSLYGAGRVGLLDKSTGKTLYELSDHLGNVRAVISDQKIASGSVCKSCGDLQTVYQGFVGSHGALNASNLPAFVTYANASFSVSNTQSTYLQALADCKLISTTIDFAGSGYVASTSSNSLNLGTGNVSIETWFKCDNTDSYKVLIDNVEWGTVLRGIQAYIYEDKLYACFMEGNAHSSWHVYTNNSIPVNQWTHVVITKTGYNPAAYAIYINGVAVSVTQAPPATSTGAAGMNNNLPLNLGMNVYAGSPSSLYEGRLRNMKVYSKALSPAEITANYNGGCMTAATVTANLVYYAKLDEGTGSSIADYSGGNLASAITNAGWTMEGMPANSCLSPAEQSQHLCYFGATTYIAEVIETHDYYPSGLDMPGRTYQSSLNFPYGYQGQEKDAATGLTNFELRQYDPRISRWYNPDPYGQHHSPYLAMNNNPVSFIDPDGGWDWSARSDDGQSARDNTNYMLSTLETALTKTWEAMSPSERALIAKSSGTTYQTQFENRVMDNIDAFGSYSERGVDYYYSQKRGLYGYWEDYADNPTFRTGKVGGGKDGKAFSAATLGTNVGWRFRRIGDDAFNTQLRHDIRFQKDLSIGLNLVEGLNPASNAWDATSMLIYGTDKYGNEGSVTSFAYAVLGSFPGGNIEGGLAKNVVVGGGADLKFIANEASRIQNIATKYELQIAVVGSRAKGTATLVSDWDYIIIGGNAKTRSSALYQLPRNLSAVKDGMSRPGSEILKGEGIKLDLPHIIFNP